MITRRPASDEVGLILWKDLGVVLVHADRRRYGLRRSVAVAGHHNELRKAERAQTADDVGSLRAQRVLNADDRREHTARGEIEMRILCRERFKLFLFPRGDDALLVLKHEVVAADDDLFAVHAACDAVRDDIAHARMAFLMGDMAVFRLGHDGLGHGVRVVLFKTRSEREHVVFFLAAERHDCRHARSGMGQRAGLIKDDGVRLRHRLHEAAAFDGDVMDAGFLHAGEHRDRHGELERAREIDHQHGERAVDVARQQPDKPRRAETVRHEPVRQMRGLRLGVGLELFGFLDHMDDAVVASRAHALIDADRAFALFHDRPGIDVAARRAAHGQPLAGDGRLIHHRFPRDDMAVERNHAAGADDDPVAGAHVADRHGHAAVRRFEPDLVHLQRHRPGKVGDGLFVRPFVEQLADAEQEDDRTRRFKVSAQDRYGNGCRVEHRHFDLPVQ